MNKVVTQGALTVLLFLGILFALQQVNWMSLFKVNQLTDKTEEKLGDLLWEGFKSSENEITDDFILSSLDSIVTKICNSNSIDRAYIKVHILENDEVNAFALPNGHLVVYSGLILESDHQDELVGVISHEIAHIQLNHVMKKLVKEIGLSVLISITTGSAGTEIIKEVAKILSSSAFDRSLEKEADIKAVDYMLEAKVNPAPFADFLYKLSKEDSAITNYLSWVSTHPDSKDRATYILEYSADKKTDFYTIIAESTLISIKDKISVIE